MARWGGLEPPVESEFGHVPVHGLVAPLPTLLKGAFDAISSPLQDLLVYVYLIRLFVIIPWFTRDTIPVNRWIGVKVFD